MLSDLVTACADCEDRELATRVPDDRKPNRGGSIGNRQSVMKSAYCETGLSRFRLQGLDAPVRRTLLASSPHVQYHSASTVAF